MSAATFVRQTGVELWPDRTRVITRLFVPGWEDVGPGDSRATPVIDRILALDELAVETAMRDIDERFLKRHNGMHDTFVEHASKVTSRIDPAVVLSPARLLLIGASFTHEFAIEGAALCNPSAVLHPQQGTPDAVDFVLSVRGIGEGHRSSIGFRTGHLAADGTVSIDHAGCFPVMAAVTDGPNHRAVFHARLAELDDDYENSAFVLDQLPAVFENAELNIHLEELATQDATRKHTATTIEHLHNLAHCSYRAEFSNTTDLSERVLWPQTSVEHIGMEDARFVRFVDDNGAFTYYGTYTAFDGIHIAQHLLETLDFRNFLASPMAGKGAIGKGLALFPRKVHGQFVALSRSDRETNAIAFSDDIRRWDTAETIQSPHQQWEILQLGNCGSPIETPHGWLVLTHGVGAMRTYSIGAILLALDEPQHVLATSIEPLLSPGHNQRDGYVPNVVYSCGGFAHGDTLVLPYGVGDQTIAIATMSIEELVDSMQRVA